MTPANPTLSYFSERLHARRGRAYALTLRRPARVKRRICMRLAHGATEVIPTVDDTVVVRCAEGSLWLTHDGDPRDVILGSDESYQADRENPLRLHALAPCVVEIEFEDEADDEAAFAIAN